MKNKEKMNNKGFSLVELIIVIAIMVILVGVLAPVYTRYVESTRKSADVSAIADIMNAMETVMIDESARTSTSPAAITVSIPAVSSGSVVITMPDPIKEIIGDDYTLRGTWDNQGTASSITATWTNGGVQFTHSGSGAANDIASYSAALGDKFTTPAAP